MRAMADEKLPTSRISRMAKIGRATANVAVRQAGTKAANVVRSPEDSDKALERRQIETAEQIVTVLGGMKGAAMKVGQVLSFVDLGLVPEEYQEEFQAKLAALRDSAPTVSFEQMSKVIEQELGQPPSKAFAELDPAPVAAASIGQVYRGRLHDGRDVAIKVQYPGVNDAVRADMQNLGMLMRLAKRITPQMDVKAVTDEIRARIIEELDYELEASNHRTLARLYRGHPFIFIPPVVTEMCRERVIVTEFVEGDRFEQLTSGTQEERDRIGEIVYRFYFGSMYRHRRFSGDPHPGNMIRMADGKIAFIDFGLFKEIGPHEMEVELATGRAVSEKNAEELHRLWAEERLPPPARQGQPRRAHGVRARRDLVVRERRGGPDHPRRRPAHRDPGGRPPLDPLPHDAPPGHEPRAPHRPPARAPRPRRPRRAPGERQLASHRSRVDVRRRPGDRAWDRGSGVLEAPRLSGSAAGGSYELRSSTFLTRSS